MARFCGKVGYLTTAETTPGVWGATVTERTYYGDVIQDRSKRQSPDKVNDDITIDNRFSIVADEYAIAHCSSIAYVEWLGSKWKVTSVEHQRPRLILSVGGVYNGQSA